MANRNARSDPTQRRRNPRVPPPRARRRHHAQQFPHRACDARQLPHRAHTARQLPRPPFSRHPPLGYRPTLPGCSQAVHPRVPHHGCLRHRVQLCRVQADPVTVACLTDACCLGLWVVCARRARVPCSVPPRRQAGPGAGCCRRIGTHSLRISPHPHPTRCGSSHRIDLAHSGLFCRSKHPHGVGPGRRA